MMSVKRLELVNTMNEQEQVTELLKSALEMLRREGWTKDVAEDYLGRHCMMGALTALDHGEAVVMGDSLAALLLAEVIREQYSLPDQVGLKPTTTEVIVDWNDEEQRTFCEVEQVFEKAIARAEEPTIRTNDDGWW